MKQLVTQCCAKPAGITAEQSLRLLKNIATDQSKRLGYSPPRDGALYRMFRMPAVEEYHIVFHGVKSHWQQLMYI